MTEATLNVHGGVLIIGSLLWQPYLKEGDTVRADWRNAHLDMKSKIKIYAPIRYGRQSRSGIYTMTFSNSAKLNLGTGFAVAFKKTPIKNFDGLLAEARALSFAEGMEKKFIKSDTHNRPWCVLGILFNNRLRQETRQPILAWWEAQIRTDTQYANFDYSQFKLGSERPCILANGQLNFPWITVRHKKDQKKLAQLDFLIATTTLPSRPKYPTINKLKDSVLADKTRKYFLSNNKEGIATFQDERVKKKLAR
jgi:hypothetical protein